MRVSSAAIYTLAALTVTNITSEAKAEQSTTTPSQANKAGGVVLEFTQDTPAATQTVSSPENVEAQQFSQNQVNSQSGVSNKSVVIPVITANSATKNSSKSNSSNKSRPPITIPTSSSPISSNNNDLVVAATDVQIVGASPELQQIIREVIATQVGGDTSQSQLLVDVKTILDTGLFKDARVKSTSTPTGLKVVFEVEPVIVRSLQIVGGKALTYDIALKEFQPLFNQPINPPALKEAVAKINQWYTDNGYSLGRVVSIQPTQTGILNLNVAEGLVGDIKFRFLNEKGESTDSKGKPVEGRTKQDFLRRQLKLKSGEAFREDTIRQDLANLSRLGLFESVSVALEGDANKTEVVYVLKELGARTVNIGGNYNADQGLIGTLSYRDQNVGGVNDTLNIDVQAGRRDIMFDTKFSSPYRANEPDSIGYTIRAFRNRGLSETFDGDIKLANGDRVREGKFGASVSFQRPLGEWDASLGFNYTRVSLRDRSGNVTPTDELGNPLSFSGSGIDDLATVSFTATKDSRDNPLNPTAGSILRLSTEQSVPIGNGNISMNRLQANFSQYVPVRILNQNQPEVFALNVRAGTVLGDLPPYETFNVGGPNSVRGYGSGDVASGRSYVLASAEYRFPVLQSLGGVLFADFASDLGSGKTVLGEPATDRNKPGSGFGLGAGVRFDSPIGLIRGDYGINDQGETRLHFGFGHNF